MDDLLNARMRGLGFASIHYDIASANEDFVIRSMQEVSDHRTFSISNGNIMAVDSYIMHATAKELVHTPSPGLLKTTMMECFLGCQDSTYIY